MGITGDASSGAKNSRRFFRPLYSRRRVRAVRLIPYSRASSAARDQRCCGNRVGDLWVRHHRSKHRRPQANWAGKGDFHGFFIGRPHFTGLLLKTNMIAPTTNHVIHPCRKDTPIGVEDKLRGNDPPRADSEADVGEINEFGFWGVGLVRSLLFISF